MAKKVDDEWLSVIGLGPKSQVLNEFLKLKNVDLATAEIKTFKDTTLYNLYENGLSFAFVDEKLDSIDFFQKDKKFKTVDSKLLPFGITNTSTGKNLLDIFGEPIEKGGGLNSRMDIWLRWDTLQIELDDQSWDTAKDANWKSITIFKKLSK